MYFRGIGLCKISAQLYLGVYGPWVLLGTVMYGVLFVATYRMELPWVVAPLPRELLGPDVSLDLVDLDEVRQHAHLAEDLQSEW